MLVLHAAALAARMPSLHAAALAARMPSLVLLLLPAQAAALAARGRMPSLADRRAISEAECRTCLETGQIGAKYDQGLDTYRVPMALHAPNRARLCDRN